MDAEQLKQMWVQIEGAMQRKGWSKAELTRVSGVSDNTLTGWKRGIHTPQPAKLQKVLDALGLEAPSSTDSIDLTGLPPELPPFLKVVTARLVAMDEAQREKLLLKLYPLVMNGS